MSQGKKRKKYYQSGNSCKRRFSDGSQLQQGMVGFLVTCNHREQESLRETYNIVNQLLHDLPDEGSNQDGAKSSGAKDSNVEEESLESAIEREVNELKEESKTVNRRLKQVNTKCKNILFVHLNEKKQISPVALIDNLFQGIKSSGKQPARFIQRILPVETTCKATIQTIEKCVEGLLSNPHESPVADELAKEDADELTKEDADEVTKEDADEKSNEERSTETPPTEKNGLKSSGNPLISLEKATYQIMCKVRNNSDVTRTEIIESVARVVKAKRPNWKVNFDAPLVTLSIDVLIKIACMSFLPSYFEYKKYNLIEYSINIKNEIKNREGDEKVADANNGDANNEDATQGAEENEGVKVGETETSEPNV